MQRSAGHDALTLPTLIKSTAGALIRVFVNVVQPARDRDMENRYWVALFKEGGASSGVECELARDNLAHIALAKYKQSAAMYPDRLVMLCDRARVLARSDRKLDCAAPDKSDLQNWSPRDGSMSLARAHYRPIDQHNSALACQERPGILAHYGRPHVHRPA